MAAHSRRMIGRVAVGLAALLALGLAEAGTALRPFAGDSYQEIVAAHTGQPFLLVFWSTDCPPCHAELAALGDLHRRGVPFELVLVSTDDIATATSITAVLEQKGLAGIESWAFADPVPERIRFAVDPHWYGELPRSYLFDATHARTAHTGPLTGNDLGRWLDAVAAPR